MAKLVNFISCIFSHWNKKSWGVVIKKKKSLQRFLSIVIMKKRFRNAVLVS